MKDEIIQGLCLLHALKSEELGRKIIDNQNERSAKLVLKAMRSIQNFS